MFELAAAEAAVADALARLEVNPTGGAVGEYVLAADALKVAKAYTVSVERATTAGAALRELAAANAAVQELLASERVRELKALASVASAPSPYPAKAPASEEEDDDDDDKPKKAAKTGIMTKKGARKAKMAEMHARDELCNNCKALAPALLLAVQNAKRSPNALAAGAAAGSASSTSAGSTAGSAADSAAGSAVGAAAGGAVLAGEYNLARLRELLIAAAFDLGGNFIRGNTTNSNQQIISLNALARAHYRRSIGTRSGAQASAAD
ncbi:hypothetical protein T492DRAFT_900966 [Pavlovales sp. CCMP2436]|nr:hypothetical protein T492DRAFT_900966 [Pavlovales sp. CCMP2436]